jgi:hypothetical protein
MNFARTQSEGKVTEIVNEESIDLRSPGVYAWVRDRIEGAFEPRFKGLFIRGLSP